MFLSSYTSSVSRRYFSLTLHFTYFISVSTYLYFSSSKEKIEICHSYTLICVVEYILLAVSSLRTEEQTHTQTLHLHTHTHSGHAHKTTLTYNNAVNRCVLCLTTDTTHTVIHTDRKKAFVITPSPLSSPIHT